MDARHMDTIRAAAAKLNASDVDGYLANFEPGCLHWIAGFRDAMPMPAFIESLHGMRAGLPDMHLEELALFGVDNFVSAHWRATSTGSPARITSPVTAGPLPSRHPAATFNAIASHDAGTGNSTPRSMSLRYAKSETPAQYKITTVARSPRPRPAQKLDRRIHADQQRALSLAI
jgi:hypothetical protein